MQTKWGYSNTHLSNIIIFTTVGILKPNAGQVHWKLSEKVKYLHWWNYFISFGNNPYPYEEIAI